MKLLQPLTGRLVDILSPDRRCLFGADEVQSSKIQIPRHQEGKTTERFKRYVQNEEIPSIVANPIKCLGKLFDASLHDHDNVRKLERQVEDGFKKIDRREQHGKFKIIIRKAQGVPQ